MSVCNASSCMYSSNLWSQHRPHQWIEDLGASQITAAPRRADAIQDNDFGKNENENENGNENENEYNKDVVSRPLREKNTRKNGKYVHVPHRDKPPQVVARRNARERRRVQAVNSAFMRLRKAVPFENHRGKRISKVKTLQNAIIYIQQLQELLHTDGYSRSLQYIPNYSHYDSSEDFFDGLDLEDDV